MNIFLKTSPMNFDNELFQMINLINFFFGQKHIKIYIIRHCSQNSIQIGHRSIIPK